MRAPTSTAGGALRAAVQTVAGADALIAVTPLYAASYSGLFKTFFDLLDEDALAGLPVLLAATGGTAISASPAAAASSSVSAAARRGLSRPHTTWPARHI